MSNPNKDICDMLIKLGEHERDVNGIIYKYHAYRKAAKALEAYGKRVGSGAEAQKLSGIGPKIAQKIQDFLQNDETVATNDDTSSDQSKTPTKSKKSKKDKESKNDKKDKKTPTKKIESKASDNYSIRDYYDKFYQMTRLDVLRLDCKGIQTVGDLKKQSNLLTDSQQICLEHFDHLSQSISREEIEKFEKQLKKCLNLSIELTGSYRRATECTSIDVLIVSDSIESIDDSQSELLMKKLIKQTKKTLESEELITYLGLEKNKLTVLAKPDQTYRLVNLYFVPQDEHIPALFYLTGDNNFNEKFQNFCLDKGFVLSERSFCRIGYTCVNGSRIKLKNEYELFQYLNHPYIEPKDRNNSVKFRV